MDADSSLSAADCPAFLAGGSCGRRSGQRAAAAAVADTGAAAVDTGAAAAAGGTSRSVLHSQGVDGCPYRHARALRALVACGSVASPAELPVCRAWARQADGGAPASGIRTPPGGAFAALASSRIDKEDGAAVACPHGAHCPLHHPVEYLQRGARAALPARPLVTLCSRVKIVFWDTENCAAPAAGGASAAAMMNALNALLTPLTGAAGLEVRAFHAKRISDRAASSIRTHGGMLVDAGRKQGAVDVAMKAAINDVLIDYALNGAYHTWLPIGQLHDGGSPGEPGRSASPATPHAGGSAALLRRGDSRTQLVPAGGESDVALSRPLLVLVSGDRDFADDVRRATRAGFTVVVVSNVQAAADYAALGRWCIPWQAVGQFAAEESGGTAASSAHGNDAPQSDAGVERSGSATRRRRKPRTPSRDSRRGTSEAKELGTGSGERTCTPSPAEARESPRGQPVLQAAPAPSRRMLCRHFSRGRCRFGSECQYLHVGGGGREVVVGSETGRAAAGSPRLGASLGLPAASATGAAQRPQAVATSPESLAASSEQYVQAGAQGLRPVPPHVPASALAVQTRDHGSAALHERTASPRTPLSPFTDCPWVVISGLSGWQPSKHSTRLLGSFGALGDAPADVFTL